MGLLLEWLKCSFPSDLGGKVSPPSSAPHLALFLFKFLGGRATPLKVLFARFLLRSFFSLSSVRQRRVC